MLEGLGLALHLEPEPSHEDNYFKVGHNASEFVFDFGQFFSAGAEVAWIDPTREVRGGGRQTNYFEQAETVDFMRRVRRSEAAARYWRERSATVGLPGGGKFGRLAGRGGEGCER